LQWEERVETIQRDNGEKEHKYDYVKVWREEMLD
jgi:hypothetical protein